MISKPKNNFPILIVDNSLTFYWLLSLKAIIFIILSYIIFFPKLMNLYIFFSLKNSYKNLFASFTLIYFFISIILHAQFSFSPSSHIIFLIIFVHLFRILVFVLLNFFFKASYKKLILPYKLFILTIFLILFNKIFLISLCEISIFWNCYLFLSKLFLFLYLSFLIKLLTRLFLNLFLSGLLLLLLYPVLKALFLIFSISILNLLLSILKVKIPLFFLFLFF